MALQKPKVVFTSDRAFVAVIDSRGFQLGVAIKGRHGYQRYRYSPSFESFEDAQREADARNTKLGLTPKEAYEIILSSMREDIPDPIEKELRRDRAVAAVDARHGYTMEFAPSPEQHRLEYDAEEQILAEKEER